MPKFERQGGRIDIFRLPPSLFVAVPVKLTVVRTTKWHSEFITDPPAEGAGLSEAQMVRIAGGAAADETGRTRDKLPVFFVAQLDGLLKDGAAAH